MMTQTTMTPITRSFFYGGLPDEQRSNTYVTLARKRLRSMLERDYAFDETVTFDDDSHLANSVAVRVVSTFDVKDRLTKALTQVAYIKEHFMVLLYQVMLNDRLTRINDKAVLTFVMQDLPYLRVIVTVDNIDAHMKDASLNAWLDTPYDQKFYYLRQMMAMLSVLNEVLDDEDSLYRDAPEGHLSITSTDDERLYYEMMTMTFSKSNNPEDTLIEAFYARFFEVAYRVDDEVAMRDVQKAVIAYLRSSTRDEWYPYANETLLTMLTKTADAINTWVAPSGCCAPIRI